MKTLLYLNHMILIKRQTNKLKTSKEIMNANSLINFYLQRHGLAILKILFNSFYETGFALGEVVFKSGKEKSWNELHGLELTISV